MNMHTKVLTGSSSEVRERRREAILRLLQKRSIKSQEELRAALAEQQHDVNQATLSRDLRDLGVLKSPRGYQLPGPSASLAETPALATAGTGALLRAVHVWLESARETAQLVVLRTPPGAASPLAVALDRAGRPEVLGTIAGDDTVLVICDHARSARKLARELLSWKQGGRS